jgi:hypothetical protein
VGDPKALDRRSELSSETLSRLTELEQRHQEFQTAVSWAITREAEAPAIVLDDEPYLSSKQVAIALGIGEYNVSTARDRGKLPARRVGRRWFFCSADLKNILTGLPKGYSSPVAAGFLSYLAKVGWPIVA